MKIIFREEVSPKTISSAQDRLGVRLTHVPYVLREKDPVELLGRLGLGFKKPSKQFEDSESLLAYILNNGGDEAYPWLRLLGKEIDPVVVVNDNHLLDGIHRCILAICLHSQVKAVVFEVKEIG